MSTAIDPNCFCKDIGGFKFGSRVLDCYVSRQYRQIIIWQFVKADHQISGHRLIETIRMPSKWDISLNQDSMHSPSVQTHP